MALPPPEPTLGAESAPGLDLVDTKAKIAGLVNASSELSAMATSIAGKGSEIGKMISSTSMQYDHNISSKLRERYTDNDSAATTSTQATFFAGKVTEALIEDVNDFKVKLAGIVQEWNAAQDTSFGVDKSKIIKDAEISGLQGEEANKAVDKAFDGAVAAARAELKRKLEKRNRGDKEELDDKGAERKAQLEGGPTPENLKKLGGVEMGWAGFYLFGDMAAPREQAKVMLANAGTNEIKGKDLKALNQTLAALKKDPKSAAWLLKTLGAKKFATGYGNVMFDAGNDKTLAGGEYADFQRNMSAVLAAGTAGKFAVDGKWKKSFAALAKQRLTLNVTSLGGDTSEFRGDQIIAPLLETGKFDKEFLHTTADAIWDVRRDSTGSYDRDNFSYSVDGNNSFNAIHPKYANPLDSVMKGLSNNPEVATDFFTKTPGGTADPDRLDRIDWLMDKAGTYEPYEYGSPNATGNEKYTVPIDANAVGDALEAASTGVNPYDTDAKRVYHSSEMVDIAQRTIDYAGKHTTDFQQPSADGNPMVDNFAGIATEYREDIYRSFTSEGRGDEDWVPKAFGEKQLEFGDNGGWRVDDDSQDGLKDFINVIGADEKSHTEFNGAMGRTAQTAATVAANLPEDAGSPTRLVENALRPYAQVKAEMNIGQLESIRDGHWENEVANERIDVAERAIGTFAGYAAGKAVSHVGGAALLGGEGGTNINLEIMEPMRTHFNDQTIEKIHEDTKAYDDQVIPLMETELGHMYDQAMNGNDPYRINEMPQDRYTPGGWEDRQDTVGNLKDIYVLLKDHKDLDPNIDE